MNIETDRDVIVALEGLMAAMRDRSLPTSSMRRFFEVGEWLLCFEGAWMLAKDDPDHPLRDVSFYQDLESYFSQDLG